MVYYSNMSRGQNMTEKRNPTYDLEAFKNTFSNAKNLNITTTALRSASALGVDRQGMVDIIQTMKRSHFYKSMTAERNHQLWQDVYHVPSELGLLYVKFSDDTIHQFLLLSFKEK